MKRAAALRMDPTVEPAPPEVDWADVGVRLTAYAVWKARKLARRRGSAELSLGARTPDDLAADAILKVLSGERGWARCCPTGKASSTIAAHFHSGRSAVLPSCAGSKRPLGRETP